MSYIRPVMRPDALVSIAIRRRQSADSIWTVSDQLRECIR